MKRDLEPIDETNTAYYLARFREVETVAFRYIFETEETNPNRHLGVVAQTLPDELLAMSNSQAMAWESRCWPFGWQIGLGW